MRLAAPPGAVDVPVDVIEIVDASTLVQAGTHNSRTYYFGEGTRLGSECLVVVKPPEDAVVSCGPKGDIARMGLVMSETLADGTNEGAVLLPAGVRDAKVGELAATLLASRVVTFTTKSDTTVTATVGAETVRVPIDAVPRLSAADIE